MNRYYSSISSLRLLQLYPPEKQGRPIEAELGLVETKF